MGKITQRLPLVQQGMGRLESDQFSCAQMPSSVGSLQARVVAFNINFNLKSPSSPALLPAGYYHSMQHPPADLNQLPAVTATHHTPGSIFFSYTIR
jgi:hypothetical protein